MSRDGIENWIDPDGLAAMLRQGWTERDRQEVDGRTVVLLHNAAERCETLRSLRAPDPSENVHVCPLTLDELREMVLDIARDWLVWGHCLDSFLDGGPLDSSLHWSSQTGPGHPSITLSRTAAGGHRSKIINRPDLGEVVFTWTQVRRDLRLSRGGAQLDLLGAIRLMPRGIDYKIPLRDLLRAAEQHRLGFSLRAISRLRWKDWGYASPNSALEGLRKALRSIDAPVRDRIEATVLASEIHGNESRAARQPGHPDHAAHLAQRRHRRKLARATSPKSGEDR